MPKEKVLNKLEVESAKHPKTQQAGKKADAPKQSDEADSSRTQVSPTDCNFFNIKIKAFVLLLPLSVINYRAQIQLWQKMCGFLLLKNWYRCVYKIMKFKTWATSLGIFFHFLKNTNETKRKLHTFIKDQKRRTPSKFD